MSRSRGPAIPKLTRPRVAGALARERLTRQLANATPVAWITAAPGSGKTTLAVHYTETAAEHTLWYQVDSSDADPATFFHYMRELASTLPSPRAGKLPSLPADGAVDLAVFGRSFFRSFFALLPAKTIWVIDNFQEADGPPLGSILREAFLQIPPQLSVIVLSLVDPSPALARLVANGTIHSIASTELPFTREESDALVLSKVAANERLLAGIHDRSSGWAAGIVMMIEHMRRAGTAQLPSLEESQASVFDYFAEEILSACSADEQRTLMLSAALPRVTSKLAEAVSGRQDAGSLFDRLHRRHLFVDRRGAAEPSYQYHSLFKSFLAARATALPARDRAEAAARAAAALEADGHAEDAIAMNLAASDWNGATRLLMLHARLLHDQGRWRTLLEWISSLPTTWLDDRPMLLYWQGACQLWSAPPVARRILERAYRRFEALGDRTGQVLAAGAATRACILDPDWSALDPWIAELSAMLSSSTLSVPDDVLLVGFSRLLYVAFARQPDHPRLGHFAERTRELLGRTSDPSERLFGGYSLVFFFTWTGQHVKGEDVIREIAPLTQDARASAVGCIHWWFAQGNHVLRFGSAQEALSVMDRALDTAARHGLAIEAVIRRHRVSHLLTLGRLDEAQSELGKLAEAPRVEPYFELRAWLAWGRGNMADALDEAAAACRLAGERGRTFYRLLDLVLLACICADSGRTEQALDHLRAYRQATAGMPGEFATFQAGLVEAFIELRRGRVAASLAPLREALDIGERQGYRSCWAWSWRLLVPLLTLALEHDFSVPYCRELIKLHQLVPLTPEAEGWPWRIRVRTLGRFEVELDGVPLRFEGKSQRKPLEMLKILIAAGDRPLSIARLIDLLWPGPDDGGRKAFDINVHRLRKLLACDAAVVVADLHASLDPRYVWVDAWTVERTLDRLVPVAGIAAPPDRLEAAAPNVFALVGGPFLGGEDEAEWQVSARVRLTSRLQRYAECLGAHWESGQQWGRAGQLYQRMVELDPLAESFYRRRMLCLRAEGRRAEAIEVFRHCRHVLATTLGVAPGRQLEQVYRELVAD